MTYQLFKGKPVVGYPLGFYPNKGEVAAVIAAFPGCIIRTEACECRFFLTVSRKN